MMVFFTYQTKLLQLPSLTSVARNPSVSSKLSTATSPQEQMWKLEGFVDTRSISIMENFWLTSLEKCTIPEKAVGEN